MAGDRIVTFPWGIDLDHFSIKNLDLKKDRTLSVLSTRSFEPIYGVEVIARAFALAARQRPELRLTLLGGGSLWADVRKILLVGGVYEKVQFPGIVAYPDLPKYHQGADIYVCASHSDGTSISLLEAFASGTPAIVSDIPGNREWVTPGENGWLFRDGDAQALSNAVVCAVDERMHLPKMGRRARQLAEVRADWEKNFPKLEQAYALAISKN
jgi:glycosyltransferase involved in cell wall biosynthesis